MSEIQMLSLYKPKQMFESERTNILHVELYVLKHFVFYFQMKLSVLLLLALLALSSASLQEIVKKRSQLRKG